MTGTLINCTTVIIGASLGFFFHTRIPKKYQLVTFQVIALFNIFLGLKMALKSELIIVPLFALMVGALIGQWLDLETLFQKGSKKLQKLVLQKEDHFSEGIMTAFLIFCIGPMTFLGSMEDGLGNTPSLLITKSIMDGITAVFLASSLGIGVLFSVVPLFLFQAALTLSASRLNDLMEHGVIIELEATGGLMIIGLAITLLDLKKINLHNFLPALILAPLIAHWLPKLFTLLGI